MEGRGGGVCVFVSETHIPFQLISKHPPYISLKESGVVFVDCDFNL